MADVDKLDCRLFVDTKLPLEELAARLADWVGGSVSGPPFAKTVHAQHADIEVRGNEEADPRGADAFPDGFLSFAYVMEMYAAPHASLQDRASLAGKILERCWEANLPAVAACDYEDKLPKGGGANDRTTPWPASSGHAVSTVSPRRNGPASS